MQQSTLSPATQQYRQRLVTMALSLTQDTALAAGEYERLLLDQFIQGALTIDQVVELVERPEAEWPRTHPLA